MVKRDARRSLFIAAALCVSASCAAVERFPPLPHGAQQAPVPMGARSQQTPHSMVHDSRSTDTQKLAGSQAGWPLPVKDDALFSYVLFDQLEYRSSDDSADAFRWDAQGWIGGDYEKLWFRSEGSSATSGPATTEAEAQLLYSRMFAPYWDLQLGLRYDVQSGSGTDDGRWFGVVGLQGFAPYRFDVEPALFISDEGDVSARVTGTTDWLLTQRLIVQPRLETELAAQDVEAFGVGQGLEYVELGLRLRYEALREVAPYVGVEWQTLFGQTADLARDRGEEDSVLALVFGVRLWR